MDKKEQDEIRDSIDGLTREELFVLRNSLDSLIKRVKKLEVS